MISRPLTPWSPVCGLEPPTAKLLVRFGGTPQTLPRLACSQTASKSGAEPGSPCLEGLPTCAGSQLRLTQRTALPWAPSRPLSPRQGWEDLLRAGGLLGPLTDLRLGPGPDFWLIGVSTVGWVLGWEGLQGTGESGHIPVDTLHDRGCRGLEKDGVVQGWKTSHRAGGGVGCSPSVHAWPRCVLTASARMSLVLQVAGSQHCGQWSGYGPEPLPSPDRVLTSLPSQTENSIWSEPRC